MPFLTKLEIEPYNGPLWRLTNPLMYEFPDGTALFTIPEGFICDLESTPWYMRWYLPEDTKRHQAAVVHDWLYTTHEYSKDMADKIFKWILLDIGISEDIAHKMYLAVKWFGKKGWESSHKGVNSGKRQ